SLLSESEGAYAVVVNGPTTVETIEEINKVILAERTPVVKPPPTPARTGTEATIMILLIMAGIGVKG
ncbi:hypothetical protein ACSBQ8_14475, partial [Staphylococcus equorum]|uniref:hypothetical protein n=1 Tax=Staphylococcus equorum TaxID=246432 RepID=UPI003EB97814